MSVSPALAAARLTDLPRGAMAIVAGVEAVHGGDPVATRLEDLGFVPGEPLRVVAQAPIGGDPIVVQVGFTRFALRRSEAARVLVANVAEGA